MFQFRRFPSYTYLFQYMIRNLLLRGFPHSDICGSRLICSSPQLFAACHVLLRLLMPRHSPCALYSLTFPLSCSRFFKNYMSNLLLSGFFFKIVFPTISTSYIYYSDNILLSSLCFPFVTLLIISSFVIQFSRCLSHCTSVVGSSGLEPPTLRLSVVRSNQLSYEPISRLAYSCPLDSLSLPSSR